MTRIVGVDDGAARIVEVWRSGADAQAFAAGDAAHDQPDASAFTGRRIRGFVVSVRVMPGHWGHDARGRASKPSAKRAAATRHLSLLDE